MSPLIEFLRGDGPGPDGYPLSSVLASSDADWEFAHNFIQWLFPTPEPSNYNPDAPVLTDADARVIRADPSLQAALEANYERWLAFCGLTRTDAGLTLGTAEFPAGNPNVFGPFNHNHLRVTRVLRSLSLLGRRDLAQEFFDVLSRNRATFADETFAHWSRAAG